MTLSTSRIEEWRDKIKKKIYYDFCDEPNEKDGKRLQEEFDQLCDMALAHARRPEYTLAERSDVDLLASKPFDGWTGEDQRFLLNLAIRLTNPRP